MKKSIGVRTIGAIAFPTPVFIIATYDPAGKPNAMAVAWGGICCSDPACIGIALREATYTYGNIMQRKAFTVNIPSEKYIREADYFGMASGRAVDKFSATGLTPVKSDFVDAPYIKEFPFILECALLHTFKIGLHTQFIAEIKGVLAEEAVLTKEGFPDIEKIKPMIFNPSNRTYYGVGNYLGVAFSIGKEKNI